ncbi:MAG: hypothetical protein ABW124_18175 [Candidatus Thiodiazotropha sp. 6PLUC9]
MQYFSRYFKPLLLSILLIIVGCGGGDDDDSNASNDPPVDTRPFLMGSTPFFTSHDGSNATFPDWRFENLNDRDLISLHVDDFWGVPWDYCDATSCANLPQTWVEQWQQLADSAHATSKPLYLTISPLGDRKVLAPNVLSDGTTHPNWNTNIDSEGCYQFATDDRAENYKASYIAYLKYLVDLVNPDYMSPAVEMNMPFTSCPQQKAAWISWYNDLYSALKEAYPQLVVFPTFQLDYIYGNTNEPSAECAPGAMADCFDRRLLEVLEIAGDRIAFSTYPSGWVYHGDFNHSFPRDTLSKVAQATSRKIWISETGWLAEPLLSSYQHSTDGSCGSEILPATLEIQGLGTIDVANETAQNAYMTWLLESAKENNLEAVVWWLNRDYLDDAVTGDGVCPCAPSGNSTCLLLDDFYTAGGDYIEGLLRLFGNMALRRYDGTPRPAWTTWQAYLKKTYQP